MVVVKLIKFIGLILLFSLTFFYTEKVIDVTMNQDEIMIKIKEYAKEANYEPINAEIYEEKRIIPGSVGKYIDEEASYKAMKKINYFDPARLVYKDIYPDISIYNNYHKYIVKGNQKNKSVSLIYILNNDNTIDNVLKIANNYNIPINIFIDSAYLGNNISIIDKLKQHEIYNYGNNGSYFKDNLIISNNIINNKANNKSIFCLFLKEDDSSLNNCADNKMLSLIINKNDSYNNLKSALYNGRIYLITNTKELSNVIEYILSKGYTIIPLSKLVTES